MAIQIREEISYYTLALCILKNITIEEAFQIIAPEPDFKPKKLRRQFDYEMLYLRDKKGLSHKEIAEIYGITKWAVVKRIERLRNASREVKANVPRRA